MSRRFRGAVSPVYLFLCLLLGGSAQGIFANMILQLLGLGLIAWAALTTPRQEGGREQIQLFWLIMIALALVAIQLIPLPPAVWTRLGGRNVIADGYRILGTATPWLPLSVAPYDTLSSLLSLIPALAVLATILRIGCKPWMLCTALVAGTFAGILLGALQVSSANPATSPWYLYAETNPGLATGFFANANHMADLLVITLPFLAAMLARARESGRDGQSYSAAIVFVAGTILVIAVGIALNGSLAGYGLSLPVLAASALIAFPRARKFSNLLAPAAVVLIIGAIAWLSTTPLSTASGLQTTAQTSVQSRQEILKTSLLAASEYLPLGSGAGSFAQVYALYEDHDRLDPTTYVNHAHNDYVEIALEAGVPGIFLIVLFLGWWARSAWQKWQQRSREPYASAAVVASAAILLHSFVDFPLRTAAISACFALCLALIVRSRPAPKPDKSQLWATRHLVIE